MMFRKREGNGILKRELYIALSGEKDLEESVDLQHRDFLRGRGVWCTEGSKIA
jgi:hypothetical protein